MQTLEDNTSEDDIPEVRLDSVPKRKLLPFSLLKSEPQVRKDPIHMVRRLQSLYDLCMIESLLCDISLNLPYDLPTKPASLQDAWKTLSFNDKLLSGDRLLVLAELTRLQRNGTYPAAFWNKLYDKYLVGVVATLGDLQGFYKLLNKDNLNFFKSIFDRVCSKCPQGMVTKMLERCLEVEDCGKNYRYLCSENEYLFKHCSGQEILKKFVEKFSYIPQNAFDFTVDYDEKTLNWIAQYQPDFCSEYAITRDNLEAFLHYQSMCKPYYKKSYFFWTAAGYSLKILRHMFSEFRDLPGLQYAIAKAISHNHLDCLKYLLCKFMSTMINESDLKRSMRRFLIDACKADKLGSLNCLIENCKEYISGPSIEYAITKSNGSLRCLQRLEAFRSDRNLQKSKYECLFVDSMEKAEFMLAHGYMHPNKATTYLKKMFAEGCFDRATVRFFYCECLSKDESAQRKFCEQQICAYGITILRKLESLVDLDLMQLEPYRCDLVGNYQVTEAFHQAYKAKGKPFPKPAGKVKFKGRLRTPKPGTIDGLLELVRLKSIDLSDVIEVLPISKLTSYVVQITEPTDCQVKYLVYNFEQRSWMDNMYDSYRRFDFFYRLLELMSEAERSTRKRKKIRTERSKEKRRKV